MFWFFSVGGKIVIDVRLGYIIIDGSIARVLVMAVIIPISALPHSSLLTRDVRPSRCCHDTESSGEMSTVRTKL